ncbi:MAG: hypothetical protein RL684_2271 [Pseudomonadota bacterium]
MTQPLRVAVPVRNECPSCGPDGQLRSFVQRSNADWVSCDCGLVFLKTHYTSPAAAPPPAQDGSAGVAAYQQRYGQYDSRQQRRVRKSAQQIMNLLDFVARGPLLDIGSSMGYTLQAARELGLPAAGLEMDGAVVERCRQAGFEAQQGMMDRLPWPDAHFQLVIMKHVLEHTPDPRQALAEVRRVLRPGGGLFIAVPNLHYHRAMRDPQRHRFFSFSGDGHADGHYVYYTPDALARLLATMGFEVKRVHPQLLHRRAAPVARARQLAALPFRALWHAVLTAFNLRKEFWLVAVRL